VSLYSYVSRFAKSLTMRYLSINAVLLVLMSNDHVGVGGMRAASKPGEGAEANDDLLDPDTDVAGPRPRHAVAAVAIGSSPDSAATDPKLAASAAAGSSKNTRSEHDEEPAAAALFSHSRVGDADVVRAVGSAGGATSEGLRGKKLAEYKRRGLKGVGIYEVGRVIYSYNDLLGKTRDHKTGLLAEDDPYMLTLYTVLCEISTGKSEYDPRNTCMKIEKGTTTWDKAVGDLENLIRLAHPAETKALVDKKELKLLKSASRKEKALARAQVNQASLDGIRSQLQLVSTREELDRLLASIDAFGKSAPSGTKEVRIQINRLISSVNYFDGITSSASGMSKEALAEQLEKCGKKDDDHNSVAAAKARCRAALEQRRVVLAAVSAAATTSDLAVSSPRADPASGASPRSPSASASPGRASTSGGRDRSISPHASPTSALAGGPTPASHVAAVEREMNRAIMGIEGLEDIPGEMTRIRDLMSSPGNEAVNSHYRRYYEALRATLLRDTEKLIEELPSESIEGLREMIRQFAKLLSTEQDSDLKSAYTRARDAAVVELLKKLGDFSKVDLGNIGGRVEEIRALRDLSDVVPEIEIYVGPMSISLETKLAELQTPVLNGLRDQIGTAADLDDLARQVREIDVKSSRVMDAQKAEVMHGIFAERERRAEKLELLAHKTEIMEALTKAKGEDLANKISELAGLLETEKDPELLTVYREVHHAAVAEQTKRATAAARGASDRRTSPAAAGLVRTASSGGSDLESMGGRASKGIGSARGSPRGSLRAASSLASSPRARSPSPRPATGSMGARRAGSLRTDGPPLSPPVLVRRASFSGPETSGAVVTGAAPAASSSSGKGIGSSSGHVVSAPPPSPTLGRTGSSPSASALASGGRDEAAVLEEARLRAEATARLAEQEALRRERETAAVAAERQAIMDRLAELGDRIAASDDLDKLFADIRGVENPSNDEEITRTKEGFIAHIERMRAQTARALADLAYMESINSLADVDSRFAAIRSVADVDKFPETTAEKARLIALLVERGNAIERRAVEEAVARHSSRESARRASSSSGTEGAEDVQAGAASTVASTSIRGSNAAEAATEAEAAARLERERQEAERASAAAAAAATASVSHGEVAAPLGVDEAAAAAAAVELARQAATAAASTSIVGGTGLDAVVATSEVEGSPGTSPRSATAAATVETLGAAAAGSPISSGLAARITSVSGEAAVHDAAFVGRMAGSGDFLGPQPKPGAGGRAAAVVDPVEAQKEAELRELRESMADVESLGTVEAVDAENAKFAGKKGDKSHIARAKYHHRTALAARRAELVDAQQREREAAEARAAAEGAILETARAAANGLLSTEKSTTYKNLKDGRSSGRLGVALTRPSPHQHNELIRSGIEVYWNDDSKVPSVTEVANIAHAFFKGTGGQHVITSGNKYILMILLKAATVKKADTANDKKVTWDCQGTKNVIEQLGLSALVSDYGTACSAGGSAAAASTTAAAGGSSGGSARPRGGGNGGP
jgi:hypothetical protein